VPRPRYNLVRYYGVLAPNAKIRKLIVPKNSIRSFKKAKGKEKSTIYKTPEELTKRDELVAPLTWAQRRSGEPLKRVFERAAIGLILACAHCVVAPCASSPTSLTQT